MKRIAKNTIALLIITSLVFAPVLGTAFAYEEEYDEDISAERQTADLLLIRPIGILSMIAGGVVFALSLPFTWSEERSTEAFKKNAKENMQKMVVEPTQYTFQRKLGDF